jgi:hypothetical protein
VLLHLQFARIPVVGYQVYIYFLAFFFYSQYNLQELDEVSYLPYSADVEINNFDFFRTTEIIGEEFVVADSGLAFSYLEMDRSGPSFRRLSPVFSRV